MRKVILLCLMALLCLCPGRLFAQSDLLAQSGPADIAGSVGPEHISSRFIAGIERKTADVDRKLTQQTEKYLKKMQNHEDALRQKLFKVDSNAAKRLFDGSSSYAALAKHLSGDTGATNRPFRGAYYPYVDSLKGSLQFLQQNGSIVGGKGAIAQSLQSFQALQAKMGDADQIKDFIKQRQQQIGDCISQHTEWATALGKDYQGMQQDLYYYDQQVRQYKELLNNPDEMEKKALAALNKLPVFRHFMERNSQLASLFNLPSGSGANAGMSSGVVSGMPSRDQVLAAYATQSGTSVTNAQSVIQGNVSSAQDHAGQGQDKFSSFGKNAGSDGNLPDFTPNGQKGKSFLGRLEFGFNLQSVRSNYYFPATSDLAVSLGYKLNDNNRIGIGFGYKIGWGTDIHCIHLSSEGASIRSFADFRIRKNIYASGGFEYNYQQPFTSLAHLPSLRDWSSSGLFGVSRIVQVKSKFFKSMKMQVLWDALSYQQIPKAPPFKFRIGYNF